ncbi:hypothetical protein IGI04_021245 [Brassica rapa subsp. trilocularis]|uniref:RNase H type-1 domain-containing protein n=1 Tax=Brassica rapa subsp. trilocularis TaxID=1813537 RepID=A0ABQ7MNG5_BRACM|nr:hypothetical protein IGI04_021245 [Brassica rapa subsp. trilocularis]
MSRRYSRDEKGKRKEETPALRKPLVRIPETNVSDLIDRNKLTLIGRVTNPAIQKTRPLLDLQLPSREVVEVEVEYEKLGKHCFFCKSLTHEDSEKHRCPLSRGHTEDRRTLGITQQNTLERIEEGRRRQEERRYSRFPSLPDRKEARWTNSRNANREIEISSRGYPSRSEMGKSLDVEENRRRYDDRHLAYRYSTPRETQSQHDSLERISTSRRTQVYKAKESTGPAPTRQSQGLPAREAISTSHLSPVAAPPPEHRRRNLDSRLSDPRSGNISSEERISAKERLSVNTRRTSGSEKIGKEVGPPQENDKLPESPSPSTRAITAITRPSSSTIFETGRLGICERSPIRTLSEDRIHVSLRLGPLRDEEENEEDNAFDLRLQQTLASKAAGKKVATQTKDKKRPARNSPQVETELHVMLKCPFASKVWELVPYAAWNSSTGNCGIGWLLRDADNAIAESSSSHQRYVPSALVAEALAVKAAITAAISSHVSSIRVYSDSKTLISLLNTQGQDVVLKGVLHDISVLARSFSSISFMFVPRLAIVEADLLAKAALFSIDSV